MMIFRLTLSCCMGQMIQHLLSYFSLSMGRVRSSRGILMIMIWILYGKSPNTGGFVVCSLGLERTVTFDGGGVLSSRSSLSESTAAAASIPDLFEDTGLRIFDGTAAHHCIALAFGMQLQCILKLINCHIVGLGGVALNP